MSISEESKEKIFSCCSLVLHSFFNRDPKTLASLLDDEFVWIGSYDFQYTSGKTEFLDVIRAEISESSAQVFDERYALLCRERSVWIVYGRFCATAQSNRGVMLYTRQRFTFVWRWDSVQPKLLHLNCTMARDVPLETPLSSPHTASPRLSWYNYLLSLEQKQTEPPVLVKDLDGMSHRLFPAEIVFIRTEQRAAVIHTGSTVFSVRKSLDQLGRLLPDLLRVHKSCLANPCYIQGIRRYCVVLSSGETLPVGKERYNFVRSQLTAHPASKNTEI